MLRLFCIDQADEPVEEAAGKHAGEKMEELVLRTDRADRLAALPHRRVRDERPRLLRRHAVLLVLFHARDGARDAPAVDVVAGGIFLLSYV